MKRFALLSVVLILSLSFGCTRKTENTQAARETTMTNDQMEQKIQSRINSNPDLAAAKISVNADAKENRVTLSGTVESEVLRNEALELARGAQPGVTVEDKIDVKPREMTREEYTEEHASMERNRAKENKETVGSSLDDAWIHSKIVAKLIGNTDVSEHKINVDVNNNVVTLRGTVDSAAEKAEAERVAKDTDGVKRVVNQLKVVAKKGA
jgi:osmotically-inducible protein OsmY